MDWGTSFGDQGIRQGKASILLTKTAQLWNLQRLRSYYFVDCLELSILVNWEDKPFHSDPKSQWVKVGSGERLRR